MKETLLQSNYQIDRLIWLRVIRNEKSDGYYQAWDHLLAENEDILVLLDERSNYVSSNSHKLGLELLLARGIQETDYINKTTSWKCYEGWLVMYCENYLGIRLNDLADR